MSIAETADLGRPSARKAGRRPGLPYVPVVLWTDDTGVERQRQIRGLAYATRAEAVARAEAGIAARRARLEQQLADRRHRALREHHGLPREIESS